MSKGKTKATRRSISVFQQIVTGILPGWKISEFAADQKIKAREFPYDAQVYLLMLGQLLHLFSLNELVDVSQIYASELLRIRGIVPAKLNTFSNANRTRNPIVIERFFWFVYEKLKKEHPDFVKCPCKGPLAKFRLKRGIYAIDSSTISLAYWCISWAKHRQKKAAVKLHMVANVCNRLPHFCLIEKALHHDSAKAGELLASLKAGDIGILDRAYNAFAKLFKLHERGGFFVVREKDKTLMKMKVLQSVPEEYLPKNITADTTIRLMGDKSRVDYPEPLRRVCAHLFFESDGKWHDMVFLTNNFTWSSTTIAELYKARWQVELLFKELKQTLQLQDFYGENENAIKWQIWAALLTHLVLRFLKFKYESGCSYTRFVGFIRAVVWLKKDLPSVLRSYGIAPGQKNGNTLDRMPYLQGFENYFDDSYGIAERRKKARVKANPHTHSKN